MNIQPELLALKKLSPLQKLILGLILDIPPIELQFIGGYDKTCGEIAKELGISRAIILREFDELLKLDLITTKVINWSRLTNVTPRLLELLKSPETPLK